MTLSLHPLAPTNAVALTALHAESFGVEGWSLAQIQGSLVQDTSRGWIAFYDQQPAGFILCQMTQGQVEILTFCVRPSHQRQGIGSHLLQRVVDLAASRASDIYLEVAADNLTAQRLYETHGFQKTGWRPRYYRRGSEVVDAVLLTLFASKA